MDENPKFTNPIVVTYDATETDDQRKKRISLGLPQPKYSFTVSRLIEREDGK